MKICRKIIKWEEIYETKQSTPSIGAAAPHGRGGVNALYFPEAWNTSERRQPYELYSRTACNHIR